MVWLTLSRNTWGSFMFKLSLLLCWLSTSSARHGSFSLSLSQWSPGMLDAAPNSHLSWFEPTVASRHVQRVGGILWMLFYDGDLQKWINMMYLWYLTGISAFFYKLYPEQRIRFWCRPVRKSCWQKKVCLVYILFFPPIGSFPLCVFSTCLIVCTCCCLCIWRAIEMFFFSSKDFVFLL